jgi:hypothetical protein
MGVITLSDVLRHVIGEVGIGERRNTPKDTAPTTSEPKEANPEASATTTEIANPQDVALATTNPDP